MKPANLDEPDRSSAVGGGLADTDPAEPRRQRDVAVTIGNEGNATPPRPVGVELYAVPSDCPLTEDAPLPYTYDLVERDRCDAELILSDEVTDLAVGQEVTFEGTWDTTRTVGEQRLIGLLELHEGPDLDRSNDDREVRTSVVVGTPYGVN